MDSSSQPPVSGPSAHARLRIRALGVLCVLDRDGEPIHAAPSLRRPMAVLVAAAAAGERGIPRDKLLGLLWPESSAERARHSLTQAIYNARRVTGLDDLLLTHGVLRVNADLVSSDIADFETAIREHDLERAVELYGGPFLDGFYLSDSPEFDQWTATLRARFEERVASALDELAANAALRGQHRDAGEWRRRLASLRPLDSTAAAAFAISLARVGDRASAFRYAQEHIAALKEQLDLEPDPSFARLVEDLREPMPSALHLDIAHSPVTAPNDAETTIEPPNAPVADDPPIRASVGPSRPSRRSRLVRSLAFAAAAVVVAAATLSASRMLLAPGEPDASAMPAAARLLVAPFSVSGASPTIAYLGRGASQLLATRLDSAGDERAIDPAVVATAWHRAGFDGPREVPRAGVLKLATDFGARRVVVGSIVGSRARTIISATVLSLPEGETIAQTSVEGSADSVGPLTSRLSAKLLVAAAGEDSTIAIRWQPPVKALTSFLSGRRAYRRAAYVEAGRAFGAALKLDSTFAPAALQLARAADRLGDLDEEDAAIAHAWPYRASLDEAERVELVALAGPRYPRATPRPTELAAWARIVSISPRRASSWYELGARLVREGRRVDGRSANEQAVVALNHALILDPAYAPARDLLAHLTIRVDSGRRAPSTTATADSSSTFAAFLRWRTAIAASDSATLREIRLAWPSMNRESARAIAMASQFDAIGLDDGARAIEALGNEATSTAERVDAVLAAHSFDLNTNRVAKALAQTTRLRELRPDSHGYLRLRVLDALYGGGDMTAARDAARQLEAPLDSSFRDFPMAKIRGAADACVLGQWHLARGDTTDVRPIVRLLRDVDPRRGDQLVAAAPGVCADLIEASFAVTAHRRDAVALVDRLDQLVLTSAVAGNASLYANIALSRMYSALGFPDRALTTLRRRTYMGGWPAYLATVWREETRLARAIGDDQRAEASSARLVSLGATPRQSPLPR